jgi:hypothetical protein
VAFATPAPLPSTTKGCTTSAAKGSCGPYNSYPGITGTTSDTYVSNNVWNPIPGWRQTLTASSPGRWHVTASMPAGNTAVVSYPSIGANYSRPLADYSMIRSSFTEKMNATARTSAWAAYDIWLNNWADEVMIQHDFANNGPCATVGRATFPGRGGTPQHWHLCKYGSELIWQLGADRKKISEQTGVVHVLAMLRWLIRHGRLPHGSNLTAVGYGWEIASTGGRPETFKVSAYTLQARCKARACR